jgi:hypothetical protein
MAMRAYITTKQGKRQKSPEYQAYTNAKDRCNNPANPRYPRYGGRGIEFRFASFEEFLDALKTPDNPCGLRPEGEDAEGNRLFSLGRIDNDWHYGVRESGLSNIRWTTKEQQLSGRKWGGYLPSALRNSAPIVVIYTRHRKSCPFAGQESYATCGCRKWLRWSVTTEAGCAQHRIPARTSSLSSANVKRRQVQASVKNQWSRKKAVNSLTQPPYEQEKTQ